MLPVDQIVKFQNELACARLRSQVQRLLESVGPTEPAAPTVAKDAPAQQQLAARSVPAEDVCAQDEGRLRHLRAEPNFDDIGKLQRELSCERLRPQLLRLRESVGP